MMKAWGTLRVSSAEEIYAVLTKPPTDTNRRRRWTERLGIEPPVWGSKTVAMWARWFVERGMRVWTWDEDGIVFSEHNTLPPDGVVYRSWHVDPPWSY